jgi:hypothetical protein
MASTSGREAIANNLYEEMQGAAEFASVEVGC